MCAHLARYRDRTRDGLHVPMRLVAADVGFEPPLFWPFLGAMVAVLYEGGFGVWSI